MNLGFHLFNDLNTYGTSRHVTRRGGGETSPSLFQKLEKIALILEKKCPDSVHLGLNFSF